MATFNKFNQFTADLANKVHNVGTDVLKVVLTNTAPVATNTVIANIIDLATAGGYTAGGLTPTNTGVTTAAGVAKETLQPVTLTATAPVGPFRYAVLYNSTAAGGPLIGWLDYGASITLANTESFTVSFDTVNGVFTIT